MNASWRPLKPTFDQFGQTNNNWDNDLASYPNKYWDMVTFHHYPPIRNMKKFTDWMAYDNYVLASNTTAYITNYLMPMNHSNVTYMITESNPFNLSLGTDCTLYGGIYAAEFAMRMSTLPQMKFVGTHQLQDEHGIGTTNNEVWPAVVAYNHGYVTNTAGLPFGFYVTAQAAGQAVVNWALNRSQAVYSTTVSGGPTVAISGGGFIPAIYAQAYEGVNGKRYVLLTNKGSNAVPAQIIRNTDALTNQFVETFVTGSNPAATNTFGNRPVQIQTATVVNPVIIPPYSVVRLEWPVFNVPQPVVSVAWSNAQARLQWTGISNVVYSVQGTSNLLTGWSTLGKVGNIGTNFYFIKSDSILQKFYRLVVP